jgi:hypothetical protein
MDFSQQTRRRRNSSHRLTQIFADKCRRMFLLHLRSPALLCSSFSFSLRVVMRRKECRRSPNTAISAEKCSIPNLQQGACLAEEVGGVGGETCGTARVRTACSERSRTGFAPNQSSSPAQRSFSSEQGVWGQHAPMSASSLPGAKPANKPLGLSAPTKPPELFHFNLRLCRAKQSAVFLSFFVSS